MNRRQLIAAGLAATASPLTAATPQEDWQALASEVKAAITGYGSADKAQVQHMVARVLRLEELPKPADAADALALALCHAWRGSPVAAAPSEDGSLTPAQRAWADAERRSRRAGARR